MAAKIIMPKLGMAMTEGVVAKWNKRDGDAVALDEEVAVVMSKKITYKLKAPEAGVLRIVAREKETRAVGAVLAFVTAPGEPVPAVAEVAPEAAAPVVAAAAPAPTAAPAAPPPARTGFVPASPAARRLAKEKNVELAQVTGTGADGMVSEADVLRFVEEQAKAAAAPVEMLATSAARKLAQERGVNLAEIPGTGGGGRITEQDVLTFVEARAGAAAPAPAAVPAARIIPFAGMRQSIADHMVESLHTTAQLTLTIEVDATELVKLRTQLKADFDLTFTDLLVKAVAKTLKKHPLLNATLIGNEIHLLEAIHIGIAVALQDGLIVPVLRDADKRTVQEIAQESQRLAQGARDGTLSVDEVTGGTFTVTNLGASGIDAFTPIINAPEAAILGVGRIAEKPVFQGDVVVKRSLLVLSLTIDHRIIDGAPGADFLKSLKELLEMPYRLLT
jgi:pyruvate dehydrogenase E2 component (dihydrolipoyllysine-residue acetyltransferase)